MVKDDGVGISKEDLECLFKENDNKESIGLKNVNERLRNKYGKEYGLILESEINKGTTATMVIPKF